MRSRSSPAITVKAVKPMVDRMEARAREFSYTLVGWPSVTGTPDEAEFPHRLARLIAQWPYFREHPEHLVVEPVPGDPNGRSSVLALVRGTGSRTVVLSGHFDVVPVDDYGDLAHLAGRPDELRTALMERLKETGESPRALEDLASGDFVPGRGMLDMKSGVAAGMAVLEEFAADPDRAGNLLLIATPDEEENSCGMRCVAAMLPDYLAAHGLDVPLAINLDATCDPGDGTSGRCVTMGTIGKLLLSAFIDGKDAHACYPFDGINAAYIAAELAVEFECAPELGETTKGEIASPPTALALKDGKTVYNVTTPGRSWLFWNVLVHNRSPAEVFDIAERLTTAALRRARQRMIDRAHATGVDGATVARLWDTVRVMRFADVLSVARQKRGFTTAFAAKAQQAAADGLDLPERSRVLTEFAWDSANLGGSAIILGNASLPYPAVAWQESKENDETARRIGEALDSFFARENLSYSRFAFFPAISDMSFLGARATDEADVTAANTPLWGHGIEPCEAGRIPIVNIGPWGRDYHHWLERAHADYTFRLLPQAVQAAARAVLEE